MGRNKNRRERVELTQEIVKDILDYDPMTGKFFWKERPLKYFKDGKRKTAEWTKKQVDNFLVGKEAFASTDNNGYYDGKIFDDVYRAHRVAFLWMVGRWPDQVDHINGIRTDNRWDNLQEVTGQRNMMNKRIYSSNKTGVCGVTKRIGRKGQTTYVAGIRIDGKRIHLIETKDFDLACQKRKEAEEKYGFHANHGSKINEN